MPASTGVTETALYVDDMQRAVDFYQRLFGFRALHVSDRLCALRVVPGQVLLIMARGASSEASVLPFGVIPPSDAAGHEHLSFGVRPGELSAWKAQLDRLGVEIESALDWPEGGRSLYFRDPDQHCVEVKTSDWDGEPLPAPAGRPEDAL